VGGVPIVFPPTQTEKPVHAAHAAGIPRVWMQQGSESAAAIRLCKENSIAEIHGECILMYAGKSFFHKPHRWVWQVLGKAPR